MNLNHCVSRQVVVGIRSTLPVEGISLLLGCELAGDKALINPISVVSDDHSDEGNELENTEVFTVCVVTRAIRKICEEEGTLFQDGSTGTSEVELKHTFSADANDNFLHGDGNISRYSTDTDKSMLSRYIWGPKITSWYNQESKVSEWFSIF